MNEPKTLSVERGGCSVQRPCSANSWITDQLPDSDVTVLMHLADKEYPVWSGYHDGEEWVSADGSTVEGPVLGWLQLEDAAVLLGPKCSLCGQRPARGGKRQGSALCESCYHAD